MSYDWMPSGALPNYLQFHLWVRDPKIAGSSIRHSFDGNSRILHLPHADILFDIGDIIHNERIIAKRMADGFRLVKVGPYFAEDTILKKCGPYFMASAHSLISDRAASSHPDFAQKAGVRLCLDSGGAQLKFGITSYVDPEEVMRIFNLFAHVGMALELPPRRKLSARRDVDAFPLALRELARVQKRNNDYFATHKREDLQLMNAAHGLTGDDFRRWIRMVDHPAFNGWAISYDSDIDPYCIWRGAAVLFREFGGADQWIHLFGVSGFTLLPLMAWLGKRIPNLTSDSSSWVQAVRSYNYLHNRNGRMEDISIGEGFAKMPQSSRDSLEPYCTCEICRLMKTFGAYRETFANPSKNDPDAQSNVSYPALAAHNLIAIKQGVASWNERASRMSYKQFQTEIERCFARPQDIIHRLEYLECALGNSPEFADRHVARNQNARPFLPLAS